MLVNSRLGENLKRLNTAGLALAKIKLEVRNYHYQLTITIIMIITIKVGEMNKMEFMKVVKGAAANIQMAKKCFEDTQLVDK